jgi:hypothetical protein
MSNLKTQRVALGLRAKPSSSRSQQNQTCPTPGRNHPTTARRGSRWAGSRGKEAETRPSPGHWTRAPLRSASLGTHAGRTVPVGRAFHSSAGGGLQGTSPEGCCCGCCRAPPAPRTPGCSFQHRSPKRHRP